MTLAPPLADPPDLAAARDRIETILHDFLQAKSRDATEQSMPTLAASALTGFLHAGGKRLRPLLCVLGWHCVAWPAPAPAAVIRVAAALEMFHAFALIHDDIIDGSAVRRGRPALHRQLADGHPRALADRMGTSSALLVGDIALCWSDELVHTAGLSPRQLTRLLPVLDTMRTELMYGQYLDVAATGTPCADLHSALTIARYKSGKYSIERPLHIGAVLADASQGVLDALTSFAVPLGEAFQLRDDLLGVFGDPDVTGKPCLDDLREGKHTAVTALALRDATPQQAESLRRLLGKPGLGEDRAAQIRDLLIRTGARRQVEEMIAERRADALHRLARAGPLRPTVLPALRAIAETATTGRRP
ncbi:polyprenyl synthetase family protein [Streptomyces sp. NPDC001537]